MMMFIILAGNEYPMLIHYCNSKKDMDAAYKIISEKGIYKRVEKLQGIYSIPELETWEVCDGK